MFSGRKDLRYLALAVFVVLLGLFNSGLDDEWASLVPPPHASFVGRQITKLAYHYRLETKEELFYHCFGQMAWGREHDREFLENHRGDLGKYQRGMLGPETTTGPILPYRDYIAEYPPVNFPFIAGPSLVASESHHYAMVFRITFAFLLGASFLMSLHLARRLGLSERELRIFAILALAGAALLGPIMITRLDAVTLLCFVAALVAVSHERPILAGLMMGLATGAKIVPLFLLPFFFLHWWLGRERGKALRFAVSAIATIGLVFIPALLAGPTNFKAMFGFHGERPIQTESTFAVLLRIQEFILGTPVELVHSFGSWNLESPMASVFQSLSTPLALAAVAITLLLYYRWNRLSPEAEKATREYWLLRALGAAAVGLMVFSKVFSPQYLIWLWPWIFLAERRKKPVYLVLCLTIFLSTQMITHSYGSAMVKGEFDGVALLAGRNFSLLILLLWLTQRPEHSSPDRSRPEQDWGWRIIFIPLALAFLSAAVCYKSWTLEARWLRTTPFNETPRFNRVEFATTTLNEKPTRLGYYGLEVGKDGNTFDWTARRKVVHYFPYGRIDSPAILEFRGLNILNPEFESGITLNINDKPLDFWTTGEEWPRVFTAWVPTEQLYIGRWNRLSLNTPEPVTPLSLGMGKDFRRLGIQMDWVSFNAVDGFARFYAKPPSEVMDFFTKDEGWIMRAGFQAPPSGPVWEQVSDEYWEAPFSEVDFPTAGGPVWIYKPGDFYCDMARFPVGSGWEDPSSDNIDRPFREIRTKGRLSLRFPPGRSKLSFSVLKAERNKPGHAVVVSTPEGTKFELKRTEMNWSTLYETEIVSEGGIESLLFEKEGFWGDAPAVGIISVRPN